MKQKKFIVVTGGVLSGLGKGVTAASIGFFFSEQYKILPLKLDGYLNTDPGTMNPVEHGEVFVLDDGFEVDMDFGHYERFLGNGATRAQSITMGKVFKEVRFRERKGDYLGKTVQMVPHVSDLIQEKILKVLDDQDADIGLIEVGGTVGDMENELFIEALRQLERKVGSENLLFVHLTYVPIPFGVNEQKTKPTQQSITLLHRMGVWPAFVVARCSEYLSENSKEKIALFANIESENVFTAPDLNSVYELPSVLHEQGLPELVAKELDLQLKDSHKLTKWKKLLSKKREHNLCVAIAGKYTALEDSYASVVESLLHCERNLGVNIEILWLETSEKINQEEVLECDAVIVPGGFGSRGVEGKLEVIRICRENEIPFLGICYGLQLAVVEFLRNVCGVKDAVSLEFDSEAKNPAITLLDEQKQIVRMGGTMRLGAYEAHLKDSQIKDLYKELGEGKELKNNFVVSERHRHRYEVNPDIVEKIEKEGLNVVGYSAERKLVEFIELDSKKHPYFVGTQAHPELKSRLDKPAPLFFGLIRSALLRRESLAKQVSEHHKK